VEGGVDLGLLTLHPALDPLVLRPIALLVNEQQRCVEDAVGKRAKGQRSEAFWARGREQPRLRCKRIEVLANYVAIEDPHAIVGDQNWNFGKRIFPAQILVDQWESVGRH